MTVPTGGAVKDRASAETAIRALPAFAVAQSQLRDLWDAEYVNLIGGDHGGLTQVAEEGVVRPMITSINSFRVGDGRPAIR